MCQAAVPLYLHLKQGMQRIALKSAASTLPLLRLAKQFTVGVWQMGALYVPQDGSLSHFRAGFFSPELESEPKAVSHKP